MECDNCKAELDEKSTFCGKCGKKIQGHAFNMEEGLKTHARFWFLAGVFKALSLGKKEDPALISFENLLKKDGGVVYDEYLKVIAHWRNQINSNSKNGIKL
jgi:predicted amidophosphoribosyltransferase